MGLRRSMLSGLAATGAVLLAALALASQARAEPADCAYVIHDVGTIRQTVSVNNQCVWTVRYKISRKGPDTEWKLVRPGWIRSTSWSRWVPFYEVVFDGYS